MRCAANVTNVTSGARAGTQRPSVAAPQGAPREPVPGTAPIKEANPPEAQGGNQPNEVPKVGSRDAPGG